MRISEQQKDAFVRVLDVYLKQKKAELYLYGSRTRNELRGGDIDLLLLIEDPWEESLQLLRTSILVQFKKDPVIGDRKIDFGIYPSSRSDVEPFLKQILPQAIKLYQWQ